MKICTGDPVEGHRPKVMRRGAEVTEEGTRRTGGAGGLREKVEANGQTSLNHDVGLLGGRE